MSEYGVYEAKTRLADLIRKVQRGERVTITNRGEPVADLVPSTTRASQQAKEAIAFIKSLRDGAIDQQKFTSLRLRGRR